MLIGFNVQYVKLCMLCMLCMYICMYAMYAMCVMYVCMFLGVLGYVLVCARAISFFVLPFRLFGWVGLGKA